MKKNGFTLVELLAVIIILAIIIVIAVPSVLNVTNTARKSGFVLFAEKAVNSIQTSYVYDANGGSISGAGCYVYDLTQDMGSYTTGNYKGYIVVDARDVDNPVYYLTLYDSYYELSNYNISAKGIPSADDINTYGKSSGLAKSMNTACVNACGSSYSGKCQTKDGFLISSSS